MAVSALDLRYFLENNKNLKEIDLRSGDIVSPAQSAHISTAFRDVSLKKLCIGWDGFDGPDIFTNNGAFEQIILACQKVKKIHIHRLKENYQCTSVAALLQDPVGSLEELTLELPYNDDDDSEFDLERAKNELLAGLSRNNKLKILDVGRDLFHDDEYKSRFKNLLCNITSIDSICQSNHTLQWMWINAKIQEHCDAFLELNRNPNKNKVIQAKIMQFYFSGDFDASSIANMPLALLAEILGIDVEKKQSAVFNILKSIPELCDAGSRDLVQTVECSKVSSRETNKRKRV